MSRGAHALGLATLRAAATRRVRAREVQTSALRSERAHVGAIISPTDYLERLGQINTSIRLLDRDYHRAYREHRISRELLDQWNIWFGDWTEFFATNNTWISGFFGGALQQAEEHNLRAREWRQRLEQASPGTVTAPGAPTPGGPADRASGGFDLTKVAIAGVVAIAAVVALSRITH